VSLCERGLAKRLFGKAWEGLGSIGHCLVLLACIGCGRLARSLGRLVDAAHISSELVATSDCAGRM